MALFFIKNKKLVALLSFLTLMVLPMAVSAIDAPTLPTPITGGNVPLVVINGILGLLWPLFVGFSVVMFLLAGVNFLAANGDEGKLKTARMALVWGIIGVLVGILAFSIPLIVQNTLYYGS